MPETNLGVFAMAVDVLALFDATEAFSQPVTVVETDRTLAFRPRLTRSSVGLVIPKARTGGLSYTMREVMNDASEGQELGSLTSIQEVKRALRGVRVQRRRGESGVGFAVLDVDAGAPTLIMQGPGRQRPLAAEIGWNPGPITARLPVYLTPGSAGDRIGADVLNALGQAGRKVSPRAAWEHQDGRWVIRNSQGVTLRVATWPTNP